MCKNNVNDQVRGFLAQMLFEVAPDHSQVDSMYMITEDFKS